MGCTTSCIAPSVAELNKSLKAGDERAMLHTLTVCPKLLSSCTSLLCSTAITPLHVACESKQIKLVEQVLSFLSCSTLNVVREALLPYCRRTGKSLPTSVSDGVRLAVDMINAKGQTPLMYACFADSPELVKLLLAHGADPWTGDRCGGRTALHYAAMGGSTASIQALMKHLPPRMVTQQGVRFVNVRSCCGLTPLHYGVFFGHVEAVRELLVHDANVNAATSSESYDVFVTCEVASSPLHFAAIRGNEAAAREILEYFAQRLGSGQPVLDPRAGSNASSQLPWQVALAHHPANLALAMLLHPGQNIHRALGAGAAPQSSPPGTGPASLASIAAAAVRDNLLQQLQAVQQEQQQQRAAAAASASSAGGSRSCISYSVSASDCAALSDGEAADSGEERSSSASGGWVHSPSSGLSSVRAGGSSNSGGCCGSQAADSAPSSAVQVDHALAGCGSGRTAVSSDVQVDATDDDDDEELCGVCFAAPQAVAPAGCGHGVCGECAEQLCRGIARKPLQCPFCRGVVTGLVSYKTPGRGAAQVQ